MATSPPVNSGFVAEASRTNAELQDALDQRRASQENKTGPLKTSRGEVDIVEHLRTPAEVMEMYQCESLDVGLTEGQVKEGLAKYGPNTLTPPKSKHWACLLFEQMVGFFSLLLWLAAFLCFFAYGLDSSVDDYLYLGIVLAAVTLATGLFSFYQEHKSAAIMEGFKSFLPRECTVRRGGADLIINAEQLVRGDVVTVKAGDAIPADLRVAKASDFKVDNSSLTGESEAQIRSTENSNQLAMESTNLAFYGTNCAKGSCTGVVIRTGDSTLIGTIAKLASTTEVVDTPIAIEIEHFIHIVSSVAVFLGVTFLLIGIFRKEDPVTNLVFMIGIIVANVPEGLLATVTVSLTLTSVRMSKKNVLVKNLEAVETLGSTTCIASDKTGTLTQNRMTAVEIFFDSTTYPITTPNERATVQTQATFDKALMVMALCNNAKFEASEANLAKDVQQRATVGDASESALLKYCEHVVSSNGSNVLAFRQEHTKIGEIPFNSTNKYQVSVHTPNNNEDSDRLLVMKGAPERIWDMCACVNIEGTVLDATPEHKQDFDNHINDMMFKGERVLGLCYAELDAGEWGLPEKESNGSYLTSECEFYDPSKDDIFGLKPYDSSSGVDATKKDIKLVFCGLIALIDPPRSAVPRAVKLCQKAGIKVIMVTGDHPETAESIARKCNIIRDKTERDVMRETGEKDIDAATDDRINAIVIPGHRLSQLSAEQLDGFLDYDQIVFARTSPAQKLKIVAGLQKKTHIKRGYDGLGKPVKHIVAVTGDGVNDSPALKQADIGIAMGLCGTNVARDSADMVLLDDNFASIVKGVEEGRLIFDNLKKSIAYTLSSNIPEISPFLAFILFAIPLPLPTFLILCIDLGTDMVPAISLAYEGREANIMTKPPRDARTDRLVTGKLVCFAYLQIGCIQALAGFFTYVVVLKDFGFDPSILLGIYWAFENDVDLCYFPPNVGPDTDIPFAREVVNRCGNKIFSNDGPGIATDADSFFSKGIYQNGRDAEWIGNDNYTNPTGINKDGWSMWAINNKLEKFQDEWAFVADMSGCYVGSSSPPFHTDCWSPAEAVKYAQTAYFLTIIIVQWSDILACKTRTLSLRIQGMRNNMLNFGLFFETALGAAIAYVPPINSGLGTRPVFFVHWLAPLPFAVFISSYDEIRKLLMRNMSKDFKLFPSSERKILKSQDEGDQPNNWVYRNTYY